MLLKMEQGISQRSKQLWSHNQGINRSGAAPCSSKISTELKRQKTRDLLTKKAWSKSHLEHAVLVLPTKQKRMKQGWRDSRGSCGTRTRGAPTTAPPSTAPPSPHASLAPCSTQARTTTRKHIRGVIISEETERARTRKRDRGEGGGTHESKADLRKRERGRESESPAPRPPEPSEAPGSDSAPRARSRSSAAHASSSAATTAIDGLPPRFPPPPLPPSSGLPPRPASRPAMPPPPTLQLTRGGSARLASCRF